MDGLVLTFKGRMMMRGVKTWLRKIRVKDDEVGELWSKIRSEDNVIVSSLYNDKMINYADYWAIKV